MKGAPGQFLDDCPYYRISFTAATTSVLKGKTINSPILIFGEVHAQRSLLSVPFSRFVCIAYSTRNITSGASYWAGMLMA